MGAREGGREGPEGRREGGARAKREGGARAKRE